MSQSQNIRLPAPIYSQLKKLAAARSTTMVEVVASFVRQAVEAGEIEANTPGLSVTILHDLDQTEEADQGPFAILKTTAGDMHRMSRQDAETVARHLLLGEDGEDTSGGCTNRYGFFYTEKRGTSIKLTSTTRGGQPVTVTMAPVVARGLAALLRKVAPELIDSASVE